MLFLLHAAAAAASDEPLKLQLLMLMLTSTMIYTGFQVAPSHVFECLMSTRTCVALMGL